MSAGFGEEREFSLYALSLKSLLAFAMISIPIVIDAWMYTCNARSNCVVLPHLTESMMSRGTVTMEQGLGSSELVHGNIKYMCPKSALGSVL